MPSLNFMCPNTHHKASAGVKTDVESLRRYWDKSLRVRCPHCGELHRIVVRKTYIDMALDEAIERIAAFV